MSVDLNHKIHKFVFLYLFCLMACTVSAEDGLQMLKQAESTMGSISFSAKFDYEDGDIKVEIQLFQKKLGLNSVNLGSNL